MYVYVCVCVCVHAYDINDINLFSTDTITHRIAAAFMQTVQPYLNIDSIE